MEEPVEEQAAAAGGAAVEPEAELIEVVVELVDRVPVMEGAGPADTQCCYAQKTETWLSGPDGARWEWYVKTGDTEQLANIVVSSGGSTCCSA